MTVFLYKEDVFVGYIRMIAVEVMASAAFLVPAFFILNHFVFRNRKKSMIYCLFSLYLAAVYALVGMPNVTYIRFELAGNLIPFAGMFAGLKTTLLNVLLFIPLGFLLPVLWDRFRDCKKTLILGFGMSLTIELLQIFTLRATDINDLITNTLGTFLGFVIADVLMKTVPAARNMLEETKESELYTVYTLTFAVMFFLQPFLSNRIWDMIY